MRRYLVVANQTLGDDHLAAEIRKRVAAGTCGFHVLVPATPPAHFATWTEGEGTAIAAERLEEALRRFRDLGAEADGSVGGPDPLQSVLDTLREGAFDEILLSTLPAGISRWLKTDLPSRVERHVQIPVTHVVAEPEPEPEPAR